MKTAFLIALGCIFIALGVFMGSYEYYYVWIPSCTGNGGRWDLPEYWRGKGVAEPWDSAPDGWYYVQAGYESKNGQVVFPLCPSCGSRLHGIWNCTIYLPDNYQGDIRLQNNVIVEVEK